MLLLPLSARRVGRSGCARRASPPAAGSFVRQRAASVQAAPRVSAGWVRVARCLARATPHMSHGRCRGGFRKACPRPEQGRRRVSARGPIRAREVLPLACKKHTHVEACIHTISPPWLVRVSNAPTSIRIALRPCEVISHSRPRWVRGRAPACCRRRCRCRFRCLRPRPPPCPQTRGRPRGRRRTASARNGPAPHPRRCC